MSLRPLLSTALAASFLGSIWLGPGCSSEEGGTDGNLGGGGAAAGAPSTSGTTASSTSTTSSTTDTGFDITTGSSPGGEGGGDSGATPGGEVIESLPGGFIEAENGGGYKVIGPLKDLDLDEENNCKNVLRVVVRDFLQSHIDFGQEKPSTWMPPGLYLDQVLPHLDEDTRKPIINPDRMPSDVIESFDEWYRTTEGVNLPYIMDIWLEPQGDLFVFDTDAFFPLEGEWSAFSEDDLQSDGMEMKNFLFTTEIHTAFEFQGDEVFNFKGDDDVWVFINNELAVDIGGIHGPVVADVDLSAVAGEFGLEVGEVYPLDLFQAERNPGGSNFRIETSLDFKECGVLDSDIIR